MKNLHGMALEADNRLLSALTLSKQGFNIAVLVEMGNPRLEGGILMKAVVSTKYGLTYGGIL